ncbi:hypothetical protein ACHAO8_005665 [Botrytis cinerea]
MVNHIWSVPEVEFLKSISKSRSSGEIKGSTLLSIFLTEQARHRPGGDLHSSECWPHRLIQRGPLKLKYRECCNGADEMTAANARRMKRQSRIQTPMQEQLQQQVREQREASVQVPLQAPQTQQVPFQVPLQAPQTQQVPFQVPMQGPVNQASRPSFPPGTILLRAGNIRVSGGSIRIPPNCLLLPDKQILLPNGRILVKTPQASPPHSTPQPENRSQPRAGALTLAPAHFQTLRRSPALRLALPRIRQVVGRELQGRAHLNATTIARGQVTRHRQRSTATELSPQLTPLGRTRRQPIIIADDEDSSPAGAEIPVSDSRNDTPAFAREFRNLAVDGSEKEDSSPASPVVSVDLMALVSILN